MGPIVQDSPFLLSRELPAHCQLSRRWDGRLEKRPGESLLLKTFETILDPLRIVSLSRVGSNNIVGESRRNVKKNALGRAQHQRPENKPEEAARERPLDNGWR